MMKLLPYRMRWEFYGMIPLFIVFALIQLVTMFFLFLSNSMDKACQTLYFVFDIINPAMICSWVLLAFGRDITQKNISFLFSLPIKTGKFIILRFIRLILAFFVFCLPFLTVFYINCLRLNSAVYINFNSVYSAFFSLFPNMLCFAASALLMLTITKSTFVPFVVLFGILAFDFCTFGKLLGYFSVTANYYTELKANGMFTDNRMLFIIIGLAAPVLSYAAMRIDLRTNKG